MKVSQILAVLVLVTLVAASGIKAQPAASATTGLEKTLVQKFEGVESVELRFDERLSGYAVRLLTRQEARERSGLQTGSPGAADSAQQEARRIAEQFYAASLGVAPPTVEDKAKVPVNQDSHGCYDIGEMGVDYVTLVAINSKDASMVLPISRIAYIVTSERTAN